jgi:hypothetical protein
MSSSQPLPAPDSGRPVAGSGKLMGRIRSQARREQVICIAIALILLAGIFLIQGPLRARRSVLVTNHNKSVGDLIMTFPRLTLGGFRGILAMVLWENAENDKNNHDWVPLETDYNAIAALEPYFGSAYIFNAWNQSYNLSAQFHDMNTKYKWVLDGLIYLYKGEKYVPDNANMIMNEANDFFLKLGTSFERRYYTARWRYDLAHLYRYQPGKVNAQLSTLAEVYYIAHRPEFHITLLPPRSGHGPAGHGVEIDGMHYRYGVSVFYFAYQEYQRALHTVPGPTDMGQQVLDSWPPMTLRCWCRDDLFYAQRLTNRIFNLDKQKQMLPRFPARVENIDDCYRNVKVNAPRCIKEFKQYLTQYPYQKYVHTQHIVEVRYYEALARAEHELFRGLVQWQRNNRHFRLGDAADHDLVSAVALYQQAMDSYNQYLNVAYPNQRNGMPDPSRKAELKYLNALRARVDGIQSFRLTAEHHKPDMSFLAPVTLSFSD